MDNIELSQEQVDYLASNILISDILSYIENNRSAYEEFLEEENGKEVNDCDDRGTKKTKTMDKLELSNN